MRRTVLTIRKVLNITASASLLLGAAVLGAWEVRGHVTSIVGRLLLHIALGLLVSMFLTAVTMTVVTVLYMRERKHKPPFCSVCSYNLTGNVSGVCPECGAAVLRKAEA